MYYKGGNMLHMIRQIMGDSAFRSLLIGLNTTFYHQTVTTEQIESYISRYAHKDLSKIFDQYLRTPRVPVLEYKTEGGKLSYRWTHCVKGFDMPVRASVGGQPEQWINPTEAWKVWGDAGTAAAGGSTTVAGSSTAGAGELSVDRNFYVTVKKTD
jgi:aminopeptidase N